MTVAGIILAGGRSSRMGRPKATMPIHGKALLRHVLDRARPQVATLTISSNLPLDVSEPVLADPMPGFPGPLAGVLAGLEWAACLPERPTLLATFPCDTPAIPDHLVARLLAARTEQCADVAVATSGGRVHPVCALWPVSLGPDVRAELLRGERGVWRLVQGYRVAEVSFPFEGLDPFFNVNTPDDVEAVERALSALSSGCAAPGPSPGRRAA